MTEKYIKDAIKKLKAAGYKPKYVESTDWQVEDDEIKLSDTVSIQVCQDNYFGLGHPDPDDELSYVNYPYVESIEEVLEQIKEYEVVI